MVKSEGPLSVWMVGPSPTTVEPPAFDTLSRLFTDMGELTAEPSDGTSRAVVVNDPKIARTRLFLGGGGERRSRLGGLFSL